MKKIPENIDCLSYDDVLESGLDAESTEWFRCLNCMLEFGTHSSVKFPNCCPNCGEQFTWIPKVAKSFGAQNLTQK